MFCLALDRHHTIFTFRHATGFTRCRFTPSLSRNEEGGLSAAFFSCYFRFLLILSTASITLSRLPKAESRKYPSPLGPKPLPGVPTTLHSFRSLSKKSQEVDAARGLEPDVGGVDAAVDGEAGFGEPFADDAGVLHVVVDDLLGLLPALVGVDRGGGLLHRVGGAVELGGGAAQSRAC